MDPKYQMRVAIVDDDRAVRESIKFLLQLEGLAVEVWASGEDFLRHGDGFGVDCLVLDCRMPDMDGFSVLSVLASRNFYVPTIMITAPVTQALRDQALRAGAFGILEKPLSEGVLLDNIRRAMA